MNLSKVLFILMLSFCIGGSYAQSCKKVYWSAQEQYKSGRFESAQKLLNACIKEFNGSNEVGYQKNPTQVFKVYKLYIASCNKARNSACAKDKRQELIDFLSKELSKEAIIDKLNSTSI